MTEVHCAICGHPCKWISADLDAEVPFGGFYCKHCDVYSETDVEVED